VNHDGPATEPADDSIAQMKRLHELREQGIPTEEEFTAEEQRLLGI
jgi:hypothetical protein